MNKLAEVVSGRLNYDIMVCRFTPMCRRELYSPFSGQEPM
jgi:hypothetical protein